MNLKDIDFDKYTSTNSFIIKTKNRIVVATMEEIDEAFHSTELQDLLNNTSIDLNDKADKMNEIVHRYVKEVLNEELETLNMNELNSINKELNKNVRKKCAETVVPVTINGINKTVYMRNKDLAVFKNTIAKERRLILFTFINCLFGLINVPIIQTIILCMILGLCFNAVKISWYLVEIEIDRIRDIIRR